MPAPDQIGRYRVERRLGSGAFAVVWLAHDDRLHAPVAVKVMAENWAYRLDIRERFLAEARLLRKATGGGVVQVFDIGELDDERPYFVMEYADRGTVADRMTAGPVSVREALDLVAEVTRGVRALHESGVVHRDIKPSNVLLAGGGAAGRERVLVADLGLAKNLAQASGLTVVAGSVGFMAPEQAEPYEGIDARADIYSLGAVLYNLLTGAVPGSPGQIMPPEQLRGGLPPELGQTIARAMEPDREKRWPTAGAFADELERLAVIFADQTEEPGAVLAPQESGSWGKSWGVLPSAVSGASAASAASTPLGASASAVSSTAAEPPSAPGAAAPSPTRSPSWSRSPSPSTSGVPPQSGPPLAAGSQTGQVSPDASTQPPPAPAPTPTPAPDAPVPAPPTAARRRRRKPLAIGAALAVLLGGAGAAVAALNRPESPTTVRVNDATKRISLDVPAAWGDQAIDSGWSPASLGLRDKKAPGLIVAQDVDRWQDLTAGVSGVFVGAGGPKSGGADGRDLTEKVAAIEHSGCSYAGSRAFHSGTWKGSIRSWSSCDSPGHSLEEIGLTSQRKGVPQVYVQIRCDGECSARTDDMLRSLRVRVP